MTKNEERLKEIGLEITRLKKEAEILIAKEKEEEKSLIGHWLVKKMADLGFKIFVPKINCHKKNIYFLCFTNKDSIRVDFHGNSDLGKLYFYEVRYENYSTNDNCFIDDFYVIQEEIDTIFNNIDMTRKMLHKEFKLIDDASGNFDYFVGKWREIIENESKNN